MNSKAILRLEKENDSRQAHYNKNDNRSYLSDLIDMMSCNVHVLKELRDNVHGDEYRKIKISQNEGNILLEGDSSVINRLVKLKIASYNMNDPFDDSNDLHDKSTVELSVQSE